MCVLVVRFQNGKVVTRPAGFVNVEHESVPSNLWSYRYKSKQSI
jgi:hypothetical protein